jgi:hypothetical protein
MKSIRPHLRPFFFAYQFGLMVIKNTAVVDLFLCFFLFIFKLFRKIFYIVNLSLYQAIWAFIGLTLGLINHKVGIRKYFFLVAHALHFSGYD